MDILFELRISLKAFSKDFKIFMFLMNPQTSKNMTSSWTLLRIRIYIFYCFPSILGSTKIKFGQIRVQLVTSISNLR